MKFMFRILARRITFPLLFLVVGLVLVQPCEGASIGFDNTGSLGHERAFPTATLLPNGTVLVAGGFDKNKNDLATAELYDPASGTWTATGNLVNRRREQTATLLPNGKVLVVGGMTFLFGMATAELYDPASGTWTATGSMAIPRRSHTAMLLPDGKVLVAGGFNDNPFSIFRGTPLASAELYDPASGTWTATGTLATARYLHTATFLPNGKVLVAGGDNSSYGDVGLSSAELYDPASGAWTSTGSLITARNTHTATLLGNGTVLVAGGYNYPDRQLASAELYDPANGTWTATGSLGAARALHTAEPLPTGKVLAAGGANGTGILASAELYDPASETWATTGSLNTAREYHTATLLPNGKVLIAGGDNGGNGGSPLASAELYEQLTPVVLNISTRLHVLTGDKVMIGGFIITGTEPKTVIVRGIGPSLAMPGALADPVIEVHGPHGELLATNDNWRDGLYAQQVASTLPPSSDLESALWGTINPGTYTVILSGKDGGTGVGLVEVYDLGQSADSNLGNISTRGFVDTGDNVMIGGLIVGGGSPQGSAKVVVRALGPSIPVTDALADPTLELHNESGTTIASNDNWKTRPDGSSQQAEIEATTVPPTNDLESAFVQTLPPGNYTAIVRGKNSTTGVGLVEVYNLP
jgi:N-acetylneuraminic acid mutarotase